MTEETETHEGKEMILPLSTEKSFLDRAPDEVPETIAQILTLALGTVS
jgi:hypothetical protein